MAYSGIAVQPTRNTLQPAEGPKLATIPFHFSAAGPKVITIDVPVYDLTLTTSQSIVIDNSQNPQALKLIIGSTQQHLVVRAYSTQVIPLLACGISFPVTAMLEYAATVEVRVAISNVPLVPTSWSSTTLIDRGALPGAFGDDGSMVGQQFVLIGPGAAGAIQPPDPKRFALRIRNTSAAASDVNLFFGTTASAAPTFVDTIPAGMIVIFGGDFPIWRGSWRLVNPATTPPLGQNVINTITWAGA